MNTDAYVDVLKWVRETFQTLHDVPFYVKQLLPWLHETEHHLNMPIPQTLQRKHLHGNEMKGRRLWITEKSDGIRFLLCLHCSSDQCALVLIGRSGDAYQFQMNLLGKSMPSMFSGTTVLDGELIWNVEAKRYYFLAFDFIYGQNQSCIFQVASKRILQLRSLVRTLTQYVQLNHLQNTGQWPLEIHAKRFYSMSELDQVKQQMIVKEDTKTMMWMNQHACDGLIITPEDGGYHATTYKWKPTELCTVDFEMHRSKSCPEIWNRYILSNSQLVYVGPLSLAHQIVIGEGDIVECRYDAQYSGEWIPVKVRHDKRYPNQLLTLISTMEQTAERLDWSDLVICGTEDTSSD